MKFIKNNLKIITGFIIGVVLASSITVYAYSYLASDIKYTESKTVDQALDELYSMKDNKYTEQQYLNYGITQYNLGARDNGGILIQNFELKSGYTHYELDFEPRFVYIELSGISIYGKKGDTNQYYAASTGCGSNANKFNTDSTGFWMNNNDNHSNYGTAYIVK